MNEVTVASLLGEWRWAAGGGHLEAEFAPGLHTAFVVLSARTGGYSDFHAAPSGLGATFCLSWSTVPMLEGGEYTRCDLIWLKPSEESWATLIRGVAVGDVHGVVATDEKAHVAVAVIDLRAHTSMP